VGIIMGELALLVLLSITSVIMTTTGILNNTVLDLALSVICGLSSFVAGFTCSKITKVKGLYSGMICGFIFFLIIFCAGMTILDSDFSVFTFIKLIACIVCGAVGGIIGLNKKEKLID
jgi:putative membrane protein (TIGR04086 family)